jgi:anaerobic magnesium-protoporphyrin IX monomethyl ester cyclase
VKKEGIDVSFWDGRTYNFEGMKSMLMRDDAITHVGISVISVYRDNSIELLKYIKRDRPDIKTIVGGVHVNACLEEFTSIADYIVKGEGEQILGKIVRGEISEGVVTGSVRNLNDLGWIDRTIFGGEEVPINPALPKPFVTIMNSRACEGNCRFCAPISKNIFGKKLKMRSIENLVGEIKYLKETMGINSFFLNDDNGMSNPKYMEEFCDAIKPLGLLWGNQGRADLICRFPKIVEKMSNAGCKIVLVGFESGSNRVLEYLKKGVTREQNIEAMHILHNNDLIIWANIMLGVPTEQPHEVLETISMVEEGSPDLVSICCFTPFPGSFLYDECKRLKIMSENPTQSFWNRGAFEPKIIGPDYLFLQWASSKMANIAYRGDKL